MKKLKGKNCFITGASSGIGRSLSIGLAREGMNLFIVDINLKGLEETKREIEKIGANVFTAKLDISKYDEFQEITDEAYSKLGDIDLLINNAGIGGGGYIETISLDDWKRIIDVNLWGVIHSLKTILPRMLERGFGHIVNTGSGAGVIGLPCHIHYVATKFAISGITEAINSELSSRGIIASVICPTVIKTNIVDTSAVSVPSDLLKGDETQQEIEEKNQKFKAEYWKRFTEKGLTPDEAAKRYIKGIKKDKLYIFDKKILGAAMFLKGVSKNRIYKKILKREGKNYFELIDSVLSDLGL